MSVTVWQDSAYLFADEWPIISGISVSAAVKREGTVASPSYYVYFKRQKADGTWPPDSEAVKVGSSSYEGKGKPVFIRERNGSVIIGNAFNLLIRCKTDGSKSADWEAIP